MGEFLKTLSKSPYTMVEHGLALVGWHAGHSIIGFHRRGNGAIDVIGTGQGDPRRDLAGVLVGNREVAIGLLGTVGQVKRVLVSQHETELPALQFSA
jgi:hypothetical protein